MLPSPPASRPFRLPLPPSSGASLGAVPPSLADRSAGCHEMEAVSGVARQGLHCPPGTGLARQGLHCPPGAGTGGGLRAGQAGSPLSWGWDGLRYGLHTLRPSLSPAVVRLHTTHDPEMGLASFDARSVIIFSFSPSTTDADKYTHSRSRSTRGKTMQLANTTLIISRFLVPIDYSDCCLYLFYSESFFCLFSR